MDRILKRQVALYMLITLLDEFNGSIDIGIDAVRSFYSDENQTIMVEHLDGTKGLAADMNGDDLYDVTFKWMLAHPKENEIIKAKINKGINDMKREFG